MIGCVSVTTTREDRRRYEKKFLKIGQTLYEYISMVPYNLSMWLFSCTRRFPGETSDDDRDKRRTGAVGSSGSAVGPRSSGGGGIDPDRVYFGTRKTAAVSRNDLLIWNSYRTE